MNADDCFAIDSATLFSLALSFWRLRLKENTPERQRGACALWSIKELQKTVYRHCGSGRPRVQVYCSQEVARLSWNTRAARMSCPFSMGPRVSNGVNGINHVPPHGKVGSPTMGFVGSPTLAARDARQRKVSNISISSDDTDSSGERKLDLPGLIESVGTLILPTVSIIICVCIDNI